MISVKGLYDGKRIKILEKVPDKKFKVIISLLEEYSDEDELGSFVSDSAELQYKNKLNEGIQGEFMNVDELIDFIKTLPKEKKMLIKNEIESDVKFSDELRKEDDLTELLLKGPTMTKEEEENFKRIDKEFEKWTKSLFA
jgi:hypothetical protein